MILDSLFVMVCNGVTSETLGGGKMPCTTIVNQVSDQSKATQTMNELQSYAQNYIEKNMNMDLLRTVVATAFVANSFSQKSIIAQIPLKYFEFDVNINTQQAQEGVKFRYDF